MRARHAPCNRHIRSGVGCCAIREIAQAAVDALEFGKTRDQRRRNSVRPLEVLVMETGSVEVEETVGCFDAGTVVNPIQFGGQMQGGAAMAQGLALTEEIVVRDGVPLNTSLRTYLLPTAMDVPGLEAMSVEACEPTGPFGAKGVGEPAVLPGAAAVANAVSAAIGVEVSELPLTPERVLGAMRKT